MSQNIIDLSFWIMIIAAINWTLFRIYENSKAIWFRLHSIVNIIGLCYAANDTHEYFTDPLYSDLTPNSTQPMHIVMGLHLFHILYSKSLFGVWSLNYLDWIHHIVMCLILTIPYIDISCAKTSNAVIFFVSGLPGAIDYYLMALVKEKQLSVAVEKKINTYLNVYLRSPGILYVATIAYVKYCAGYYENAIFTFTALAVLFWNAQFFMVIVVYAYGKHKKQYHNSGHLTSITKLMLPETHKHKRVASLPDIRQLEAD